MMPDRLPWSPEAQTYADLVCGPDSVAAGMHNAVARTWYVSNRATTDRLLDQLDLVTSIIGSRPTDDPSNIAAEVLMRLRAELSETGAVAEVPHV